MKWIGWNDRPDGAVDGEEVVWGNSEQDFDVWKKWTYALSPKLEWQIKDEREEGK